MFNKLRCHSGSSLAGTQSLMKRLWIPAQQTAGMIKKAYLIDPEAELNGI